MSNNILNTEIWRDIAGYEGIYQVSNTGKVRRVGGNVLSIHINKQRNNSCTVMLSYDHKQTRKAVHRLVAFAFPEICGEYFDGADIDHKDTDPTNNKAENLHWVTKSGNMRNPLTIGHLKECMTDEKRAIYSKRMKENNPSRLPGAWIEERRKAVADRNKGREYTEGSKEKMRVAASIRKRDERGCFQ